jgi:molybdopterin converting factor small subunit
MAAVDAGRDWIELELSESACVRDVMSELAKCLPNSAALISRSRLAVNHAYARSEEVLRVGDELALIPPVSGG